MPTALRKPKLEPGTATPRSTASRSPSPSPYQKRGRDEREDEYKPALESSPDGDDGQDDWVDDDGEDEYAPARRVKKPKNGGKTPKQPKTPTKSAGAARRTNTPMKRWSADDNEALLTAAIGSVSVKNFAGVPGRNPKQCYDQWTRVLLPYLRNKAREKGV